MRLRQLLEAQKQRGFVAILAESINARRDVLNLAVFTLHSEAQAEEKRLDREYLAQALTDNEHDARGSQVKSYIGLSLDGFWVVFGLAPQHDAGDMLIIAYAQSKGEVRLKVKELTEKDELGGEFGDAASILNHVTILELS